MPRQTYHLPNLTNLRQSTANYHRHQTRLKELSGQLNQSRNNQESKPRRSNTEQEERKAPSIFRQANNSNEKKNEKSGSTGKKTRVPPYGSKMRDRDQENLRLYRALTSSQGTSVLAKYIRQQEASREATRSRINRYLKTENRVNLKNEKTFEQIKKRELQKERIETDRSMNIRAVEESLKQTQKKHQAMRGKTTSMSNDIYFEADLDQKRLRRPELSSSNSENLAKSIQRLQKVYQVSGRVQTEAVKSHLNTKRNGISEEQSKQSKPSILPFSRVGILQKLNNLSSQTAQIVSQSTQRMKKTAADVEILSFTPEAGHH